MNTLEGRPELTQIQLRLPTELLERLDYWRGRERGVPNRSEAVRRILIAFLDREDVQLPVDEVAR